LRVEGRTERESGFNFEKLEVWWEAQALAERVYQATRAFPGDERFGLTTQVRRAAVSISSNIAEGSSRASRLDFARFVEIAAGSVFELVSQVNLATRLGYLTDEERGTLCEHAARVSRMLSGLRKSLVG
jgi:four helix bundle protein